MASALIIRNGKLIKRGTSALIGSGDDECGCFVQALKCVDDSETGYWTCSYLVDSAKIYSIEQEFTDPICVYFDTTAPFKEIPEGGIVAEIDNEYDDCETCTPAIPCTNCGELAAQTPKHFDVTFAGVSLNTSCLNCSGRRVKMSAGAFSGTWRVSQTADPCIWTVTENPGPCGVRYRDGSTPCDQTFTDSDKLVIEVDRSSAGYTVTASVGVASTHVSTIFQADFPVATIECSSTNSFDNGLGAYACSGVFNSSQGNGGTVTVTPVF